MSSSNSEEFAQQILGFGNEVNGNDSEQDIQWMSAQGVLSESAQPPSGQGPLTRVKSANQVTVATELKEGILLINKPQGKTSFSLIRALRKLTGIKKIGHAGTLDPFAIGVMVLLIGRNYTRLSSTLLLQDKEYLATVSLGVTTDTYDCDGKVVASSKKIPTLEEIQLAVAKFQGEIEQIPPMYSAKKIRGKKLYEIARKGGEIERTPAKVVLNTEILAYSYPHLFLRVTCSKGTYIRSLAHEIGQLLGCGGHLSKLNRTRSGIFTLKACLDGKLLDKAEFDITPYLLNYEDIR